MMKKVFIAGDNIITSLGFTTNENIGHLEGNIIGLKITDNKNLTPVPVPLSMIDSLALEYHFNKFLKGTGSGLRPESFTKLEKMFIVSIHEAIKNIDLDLKGKKSLLIISMTKGNIDLLEEENKTRFNPKRIYLWEMAEVIRRTMGFFNSPLIVSNACVSGVLGIGVGYRYLKSGSYDHAVVCGGDILSQFVISGFQSFQSLSPQPCRPYDISRNGLSLGEACGTIVLTSDSSAIEGKKVIIEGTSTSNDANHISGPSRTGEELAFAISRSLKEAHLQPSDIGYISAHGTATAFNDEMEAKAFSIAGLKHVPLNSFKGYWGHTLGAAGVIESVAAIHSMKKDILFKSAGYSNPGVTEDINVITKNKENIFDHLVKTASGFGGCNASIVFGKS
jgi:3-oxoacyl-[acyl-carrier-protein] synthase I